MSDIYAITPLGAREPVSETHGPITLTENIGNAFASFSARLGKESEAETLLAETIGAPCPPVGRASFGDLGAFWMGPGQWMIAAPIETHELLAEDVAARAQGIASVTEQTDAWCRFDLEGDGLKAVFERLCPINMRDFEDGSATRTSIDHLGCFVISRLPERITVLGPRSSAGSLHHARVTAIRSAH